MLAVNLREDIIKTTVTSYQTFVAGGPLQRVGGNIVECPA